jgi:hypothetical protein
VYGHSVRSLQPAGIEAVEITYRCPIRRCAGRGRDDIVDSSSLRCGISGQELRRERLEP